jgi:acetyl-CoA acyltransferase
VRGHSGCPHGDVARPALVDTLGLVPGRLAQLGERRLDKAEVTGSSPVSPITRLITTLLHELEHCEAALGLVTICTAGGTGTGTLIERV